MILNRLDDPTEINQDKVLERLSEGKPVNIQFRGHSYTDRVLDQIDDLCKQHSSKLEIRFYDAPSFNADDLLKIPHVKNLNLDYFDKVENTAALKELIYLEKFFLRVKTVDDTSLWKFENLQKLKILDLEVNKNVDGIFKHLSNYNKLESLVLSGKPINIQAVGNAKNLEQLHLWHLPKSSTLEGLNNLFGLKKLSLTLGGRENMDELKGGNIEVLSLNQVRGFKGFSDLSKFTNLQWLDLMDLAQVRKLDFPVLPSLKKVTILNCKNLELISGFSNLPALESLMIAGINIDFEEFIKMPFPPSLKVFNFFSEKVRRDKEIAKHLKSLGYLVSEDLYF